MTNLGCESFVFLCILMIIPTAQSSFNQGPLDIFVSATALSSSSVNGFRVAILGTDRTTNITLGKLYWPSDEQNVTWADTGRSRDINFISYGTRDMPNNKVFDTTGDIVFSVNENFVYLGVQNQLIRGSVGVFSVEVSKGDVVTKSAVVVTKLSGSITMRYRTETVGVGESITIRLDKGKYYYVSLRWKHNYGDDIAKWNDHSQIAINNARAKDKGVYECYQRYNYNGDHGMMRLIVRDCPTPKWNPPNCEENCPVCYNGGVCDDKTGTCICAIGFMGQQCEAACPSNGMGRRNCTTTCNKSNPTCAGVYYCGADPAGCTCFRGLSGDICHTACTGLSYGADCRQTCHCSASSCDNSKGCSATAVCSTGYTGPGCQVLKPDYDCPFGFFGALCIYECHCQRGGCSRDGKCESGCHEAWGGSDCSIALPYLSHAPILVNQTTTTITIDTTWIYGEDYGTGTVVEVKVSYRTSPYNSFTVVNKYGDELITLENFVPPHTVEFFVQHVRLVDGVETIGPSSEHGYAYLVCLRPLMKPRVSIKINSNETIFEVEPVSDSPEKIQCDAILRYQVRYRSIDGIEVEIINTTNSYALLGKISGLSKCVAYHVDARVVNSEDIAGDWGETVHIPPSEPFGNENSFANETSLSMKWNPPNCNFDRTHDIVYHYQLILDELIQEEGSTKNTEVFITNKVKACKLYTFKVYMSYMDVNGTALVDYVTTANYPGPPTITSLTATSSSIDITWKKPFNGSSCDIIQYNVTVKSCFSTISKVTNGTYLHVDKNILRETEYSVMISAMTSKGYGDYSPIEVIKTKGNNKIGPVSSNVLSAMNNNYKEYAVAALIMTVLLIVIILCLLLRIRKLNRRCKSNTEEDTHSKYIHLETDLD